MPGSFSQFLHKNICCECSLVVPQRGASVGFYVECVAPRLCWWGVQWRVWSEGQYSPRLGTQPAALNLCAWSLVTWVPLWDSLGGPLCQWPCYHRWIASGNEAGGSWFGKKQWRRKGCRKDKDHDLWYGSGPPAEFRWLFMPRLLHWSGQQQHLLQQLQALGAQEMQWAQALDRGPWLQLCTWC